MQIYQVGGSVRDKILNKPSKDRDFVVIGATEEEMLSQGFKQVGKSFPVFLHPKTKEEYALARKEIKTGPTHKDFQFIFDKNITLEEDSLRRDFTCNAIYQNTQTGELIDFHNGIKDIKNHTLRHISEHFVEDPLRVLRMCRFSAELDFNIAPETMKLCKQMVKNGDLKHLSKERIWQEFEHALSTPNCYKFILSAKECGALGELLPELEELWSVPEREDFHPEKNSGEHTMLALKSANSTDSLVNFAVLFHDIGKIATDKTHWPSHHFHDKLGVEIISKIAKRLRVPEKYSQFAKFIIPNHMIYHKNISENKEQLANIAIELSRQEDIVLSRFIDVLRSDMKGRAMTDFSKDLESFSLFEEYLKKYVNSAKKISVTDLPEFEETLEKVKQHKLPTSAINDILAQKIIHTVK